MNEREQELDLQVADMQDELNRMRNKWNTDLETLDDLYAELKKIKNAIGDLFYAYEYGEYSDLCVRIEELKQRLEP